MGSVVLHVIVNLCHILTISIHEFYYYVDQLSLLVIYVLEWKSLWILWIIGGCEGGGGGVVWELQPKPLWNSENRKKVWKQQKQNDRRKK